MAEMDVGKAVWNQRQVLAAHKELAGELQTIVGRPTDLNIAQWLQLLAVTVEFAPDKILELGRGYGNSTCVFALAANHLGPQTTVESLCLSSDWDVRTHPNLLDRLSEEWLSPVNALTTDITDFEFDPVLKDSSRVLVFWDAHGWEVAETVLSSILPLIEHRDHLVVMHDLSDARYSPSDFDRYNGQRLWHGTDMGGPRVRLGQISSAVAQAVAITDFATRNRIELRSADHDLHTFFEAHPQKFAELSRLLKSDLSLLSAHWFHFTLEQRSEPYTFPAKPPRRPPSQADYLDRPPRLKMLRKIRHHIKNFEF